MLLAVLCIDSIHTTAMEIEKFIGVLFHHWIKMLHTKYCAAQVLLFTKLVNSFSSTLESCSYHKPSSNFQFFDCCI